MYFVSFFPRAEKDNFKAHVKHKVQTKNQKKIREQAHK